jgi:hypothetical protein
VACGPAASLLHLLDRSPGDEILAGNLHYLQISLRRLGAQRRRRQPATEEQPAGFGKRHGFIVPDIHAHDVHVAFPA